MPGSVGTGTLSSEDLLLMLTSVILLTSECVDFDVARSTDVALLDIVVQASPNAGYGGNDNAGRQKSSNLSALLLTFRRKLNHLSIACKCASEMAASCWFFFHACDGKKVSNRALKIKEGVSEALISVSTNWKNEVICILF